MTPHEFEDDQRTQLLTTKMRDLIVSSVHVTDAEVRELFDSRQEKVDLEFIQIASADFLDAVTVEPEALEDFYNTRRESFRQPERVRFAYAAYPADHFAADIAVSDAEIETVYTAQKDTRFTTKERVQARHILLNSAPDAAEEDKTAVRAAATALLERVTAGEDFAALAEEHSEDSASGTKGGDLGFFTRGRMVKAFEEAAFSLSAGEVSDIVETQFGFHIIKVEAKEAEQARPLEEVAEEIREELMSEKAQVKAREAAQQDQKQVQQQAESGATLKDIVEARGLTVVESSLLARDETVPNLGRQPQVLQAAFNTDPGRVSNPVQIGETSYLILTHEKTDSLIPDFAEVKDEVEDRYKSEQAEHLANEEAETLLTQVKESKSLAQAVDQEVSEGKREEAREIEETGTFARQGGYIPKIGSLPAMKKAAFRLTPENPVVPKVYMWGGNAFVAVLFEHIPASPDEFEKQEETIRKEILNQKRAGAGSELIQYLKKQATIEMNQEALLQITT
jgi:peptidyl-prolyl cis-trans isomerase D